MTHMVHKLKLRASGHQGLLALKGNKCMKERQLYLKNAVDLLKPRIPFSTAILAGGRCMIEGILLPGLLSGHNPLCPLVFAVHTNLNAFYPLSGMFLIFTDPACDEQKAKRWKKPMVTAPSEGGYPAHDNPHISECFSTPPGEGTPAALAGYFYLQ